jgi:two-component system sensor histidine kinase KdpD
MAVSPHCGGGGRWRCWVSRARTWRRCADHLPLLASLLDQAGLALERIVLEAEMAGVEVLRQQDRLRAALLSSVSHDLRTPLTAVLGLLRDLAPANPEQARTLALARAGGAAATLVANLLDMVRIESGGIDLAPNLSIWPRRWPARCTICAACWKAASCAWRSPPICRWCWSMPSCFTTA